MISSSPLQTAPAILTRVRLDGSQSCLTLLQGAILNDLMFGCYLGMLTMFPLSSK